MAESSAPGPARFRKGLEDFPDVLDCLENVDRDLPRVPVLLTGALHAAAKGRLSIYGSKSVFDIMAECISADVLKGAHLRGTLAVIAPVSISPDCHITMWFGGAQSEVDAIRCLNLLSAGPAELDLVVTRVGAKSVVGDFAPHCDAYSNNRAPHVECVGHGSAAEKFWLSVCDADATCRVFAHAARLLAG